MSLSKGNSHKFISLFVAGNTRGLRVENRGSTEVRTGLLKDGPEGRQGRLDSLGAGKLYSIL